MTVPDEIRDGAHRRQELFQSQQQVNYLGTVLDCLKLPGAAPCFKRVIKLH